MLHSDIAVLFFVFFKYASIDMIAGNRQHWTVSTKTAHLPKGGSTVLMSRWERYACWAEVFIGRIYWSYNSNRIKSKVMNLWKGLELCKEALATGWSWYKVPSKRTRQDWVETSTPYIKNALKAVSAPTYIESLRSALNRNKTVSLDSISESTVKSRYPIEKQM